MVMTTPRPTNILAIIAIGVAMSLSACAANENRLTLSPAAEQGRSIANSNGCGACHGTSGEGGVGPDFVGLSGSTVQLADGSSVTADRAYLVESIKEPGAKLVDGYGLPMPTNRLTDDEIDRVITYIEALAAPSEGSTT